MSAAIFESKSQNSAKKLVRALTGDEKPGFFRQYFKKRGF
jgi:hypothetical protein